MLLKENMLHRYFNWKTNRGMCSRRKHVARVRIYPCFIFNVDYCLKMPARITPHISMRLIYLIAARHTQYKSTQIKTLPVKHDLYMKLATGANSRRQQRFICFNPIRCIKHISIHSYIYHFTSESYIKAQ